MTQKMIFKKGAKGSMWFLLQKYLRRAQQGHFLTTLQKHQSYIIAVFQFICIILIIIGLHRSNTIGYNFGCCSSHYSTLGHSPSIIYSLLYSISLEQMVSFEKYRKSYFCPIPGCHSSKPIKKLSNHLASVHRLSTKERFQHLAEAQRSQLDPLPKGQSTLSLKKQYIVQS